jgi:hypothetical protein
MNIIEEKRRTSLKKVSEYSATDIADTLRFNDGKISDAIIPSTSFYEFALNV